MPPREIDRQRVLAFLAKPQALSVISRAFNGASAVYLTERDGLDLAFAASPEGSRQGKNRRAKNVQDANKVSAERQLCFHCRDSGAMPRSCDANNHSKREP